MTECNHCGHSLSDSCILKVPIFNKLSQDEVLEVASVTIDRTFQKGEAIFQQGDKLDKLYVIHEGKVKISRVSEQGREQILRILEAGEFLGELVLLAPSTASNSAEALEKTVVCEIASSKIKELMLRSSQIALKVLEEVTRRLEKAENLVENIGLYNVETRIAKTLLDLAGNNLEISLPVSKKDLAAQINVSQETLSRKLTLFQENGWIKLSGQRRISLLNRKALKELTE